MAVSDEIRGRRQQDAMTTKEKTVFTIIYNSCLQKRVMEHGHLSDRPFELRPRYHTLLIDSGLRPRWQGLHALSTEACCCQAPAKSAAILRGNIIPHVNCMLQSRFDWSGRLLESTSGGAKRAPLNFRLLSLPPFVMNA